MEICKSNATRDEHDDAETYQDIWISALTYFRDLEDQAQSEARLTEALKFITNENDQRDRQDGIDPRIVINILQDSKPKLKFTVLKNYLLNSVNAKARNTALVNQEVQRQKGRVEEKKKEIQNKPTTSFNMKTCSQCG